MTKEYINLLELEGKWHIILTNFPMWLQGDKKNPNFNYKWSKEMALFTY